MDVFFSTVVRGGLQDKSGELVKLDWKRKRVVRQVSLAPFDPPVNDPNPRGNSRGGRGIVIHGDQLLVATYHSLHIYDLDLNFKGKISHPLFVGLHELAIEGETVWATSTSIDAVVGLDITGEHRESWWPREDAPLQNHLSIEPLNIDKSVDNRLNFIEGEHLKDKNHLHLNAVARHGDRLFALFNSYGMVYDLTNRKIVLEDPSIRGCHNLVFVNDFILVNDTRGRRVMVYDLNGRLVRAIDLLGFPEVAAIYKRTDGKLGSILNKVEQSTLIRKPLLFLMNLLAKSSWLNKHRSVARPIFVRGMAPIADSRILVSFSPATIVEIDFEKGKLLDFFQYSQNVEVAPHGLLVVT